MRKGKIVIGRKIHNKEERRYPMTRTETGYKVGSITNRTESQFSPLTLTTPIKHLETIPQEEESEEETD